MYAKIYIAPSIYVYLYKYILVRTFTISEDKFKLEPIPRLSILYQHQKRKIVMIIKL